MNEKTEKALRRYYIDTKPVDDEEENMCSRVKRAEAFVEGYKFAFVLLGLADVDQRIKAIDAIINYDTDNNIEIIKVREIGNNE